MFLEFFKESILEYFLFIFCLYSLDYLLNFPHFPQ